MTTYTPYLTIIFTRFAGATNARGSRIVATATCFGRKAKAEHNYLHEYGGDENHLKAALKLLHEHTTHPTVDTYELVGQSDNPSGSGMALVFKRVGV